MKGLLVGFALAALTLGIAGCGGGGTTTPGGEGAPPGGGGGSATAVPIVFESDRDGNWEVYFIRSDRTGRQNLTNNPASDTEPAMSPDKTKVAFVSDRGGKADVWIMGVDGSNPQNITKEAGVAGSPSWYAEGARLLLSLTVTGKNNDRPQIYAVNTDGSNLEQITDNQNFNLTPIIQSDVSRVTWATGDSLEELDLASMIIGKDERVIVERPASDWRPSMMTPKVRPRLILEVQTDGKAAVYEVETDGRRLQPVVKSSSFNAIQPVWGDLGQAAGSYVLFSTDKDGNWNVYFVPTGAGEDLLQKLVQVTDNPANDRHPSW
ncbi:MAG: PD40 domain-containing protein [Chloroflexi bacterium]|nr:PD40 domain-containing protein [Chloroflexota bacterium]